MGLVMGPSGGRPGGSNNQSPQPHARGPPPDASGVSFVLPGLGNALANLAQE